MPEAAESLGSEPRGDLRRWARAVIDAGADAVVGHGPHVLRGIEFYRGRPIAYSLGNFLTYRGFNLSGPLGVTGVLQLEFDADRKLAAARFVPMVQRPPAGARARSRRPRRWIWSGVCPRRTFGSTPLASTKTGEMYRSALAFALPPAPQQSTDSI